MKNLDIQISEKVAEEASKQINSIKKELEDDKNAHIQLLSDTIKDCHNERKFIKNIAIILCVLISMSVIGSFILGMYNQRLLKEMSNNNTDKMLEFLSNYSFNTNANIDVDDESNNSGNINIEK